MLPQRKMLILVNGNKFKIDRQLHFTARSDTIFIQIYMDAPPGVPEVSKNKIFLQIKLLSFCSNIEPKRKE